MNPKVTLRLLLLLALIFGQGRMWGIDADDDRPLDPLPTTPGEITAAAALLNRGDTAAAIANLDAFLRQHPDDVGALLLRSVAAEKANDLPGAVVFSGRAIAAQRKATPTVHADPGMMLRHQELFDRLVAENPAPKKKPAPKTKKPPATTPALPTASPAVPKAATGPDGQRPGQDVQWASGVRASSAYQLTGDYSAERAIGPPTVTRAGDSVQAWCSKTADAGEEWLELDFDPPVLAKAVRVVQNWNPGAVTQIEVVDADGATTIVWRGPDATVYAANQIGVLEAPFAAPSPRVVRVKVTFDTKQVKGWNEIDAVGLVPVR
jgi:hypothetical protein